MDCRTAVTRMSNQAPLQKNDRTDALQEFAQCTSVLQYLLYDDRPLDDEEFLFMNNHFQVLQLAYHRWERRHRQADEFQS